MVSHHGWLMGLYTDRMHTWVCLLPGAAANALVQRGTMSDCIFLRHDRMSATNIWLIRVIRVIRAMNVMRLKWHWTREYWRLRPEILLNVPKLDSRLTFFFGATFLWQQVRSKHNGICLLFITLHTPCEPHTIVQPESCSQALRHFSLHIIGSWTM